MLHGTISTAIYKTDLFDLTERCRCVSASEILMKFWQRKAYKSAKKPMKYVRVWFRFEQTVSHHYSWIVALKRCRWTSKCPSIKELRQEGAHDQYYKYRRFSFKVDNHEPLFGWTTGWTKLNQSKVFAKLCATDD